MKWKTPEVDLEESIHFTDDYVVHGRGFTVEDDIWYDEYAVHFGHSSFWNNVVSDHYEDAKEVGKWFTRPGYPDDGILYWSVTGSQEFILQYPMVEHLSDRDWDRLRETLRELSAPGDMGVTIDSVEQKGSNSHDILNPGSKTGRISTDVSKVMETSLEVVKRW